MTIPLEEQIDRLLTETLTQFNMDRFQTAYLQGRKEAMEEIISLIHKCPIKEIKAHWTLESEK